LGMQVHILDRKTAHRVHSFGKLLLIDRVKILLRCTC
jgi:hypothetical protein